MEIKKGTIVGLPFNEVGIVKTFNNKLLWGFKYKVEILKGSVFNTKGEIADFKLEQLEFIYQTR